MALAKEPTSQDHSRIGSIQACSLYGNFLGAGSSTSSAHQVSDLSCSGIYRFDHEHHRQKMVVHDQTGDSTEKASSTVFVKNLSMMDTKGYVFDATNFHPEEEAHESLINFNAAAAGGDHQHDTFVHSSAGSSNLLSFVQNEEPAPDQESYSKTSDQHDHQDEYSSLWPESTDTNNYFVSNKCNNNASNNNGRLLENFNSYQTASSTYGSMMSNTTTNNTAVRENQHGDHEIFGLFFNEAAMATIDSNNFQDTGTPAAGYNKRHADMGESMQAQKKQCTGAITKKPKGKIVISSSKDPQSIAAKNRRERISERLKVLQELVPNGTKVDLVTMLEKAISYVKFLQLQVKVLATDDFWPAQGGKAPEISQVKEAIDAILLSQRDRN